MKLEKKIFYKNEIEKIEYNRTKTSVLPKKKKKTINQSPCKHMICEDQSYNFWSKSHFVVVQSYNLFFFFQNFPSFSLIFLFTKQRVKKFDK